MYCNFDYIHYFVHCFIPSPSFSQFIWCSIQWESFFFFQNTYTKLSWIFGRIQLTRKCYSSIKDLLTELLTCWCLVIKGHSYSYCSLQKTYLFSTSSPSNFNWYGCDECILLLSSILLGGSQQWWGWHLTSKYLQVTAQLTSLLGLSAIYIKFTKGIALVLIINGRLSTKYKWKTSFTEIMW